MRSVKSWLIQIRSELTLTYPDSIRANPNLTLASIVSTDAKGIFQPLPN